MISSKVVWVIILIMISGAAPTLAADWPQFRGPNRDGKSAETSLLKSWPDGGPKSLWSIDGLGIGFSSTSIADGTVYVTGMVNNRGILFAYDLDGKLKWKTDYGPEWTKSYKGARTTPTIEGDFAYLISGNGRVVCFETKGGKIKWQFESFASAGVEKPTHWGMAESPLIVDDKLICTPAGQQATMLALNKKTGVVLWENLIAKEQHAYCAPLLVEFAGRKMIVTQLAWSVIAVDAENGHLIWQDKFADYQKVAKEINPNTPIYHDGCFYVTSGSGSVDNEDAMLKLSPDGNQVTRKWIDSVLDCYHGGVVLVDGYLYGANSYVPEKESNSWVCVDWNTGKQMYKTPWFGKGCVIFADGMLYCYEENKGTFALVKATPDAFEIVSSFSIDKGKGQHWAHPAISDGRLYIRHGEVLMAYDIKID
ncbi:MAG: PQQ-binding-like beta-propeller repeat protein [Sedimentisphaerales bacterium]|nr:PQQ-binding-like beta-propeller repeat protein [Sedimentisphaerales bacterium]